MVNHGKVWPWLTMVKRGTYDYALTMLLTMGWSRPLTMVKSMVFGSGAIFQSAVNHDLTMVKTHVWTMVDHGWTMLFSPR